MNLRWLQHKSPASYKMGNENLMLLRFAEQLLSFEISACQKKGIFTIFSFEGLLNRLRERS